MWSGMVRFGSVWLNQLSFGEVWSGAVRCGTVWFGLTSFQFGQVRLGKVRSGAVRFGSVWPLAARMRSCILVCKLDNEARARRIAEI